MKNKNNLAQEKLIDLRNKFYHLDEWLKTPFAPTLSEKEMQVLALCENIESFIEVGQKLGKHPATIRSMFDRTVNKINQAGEDYYLWLMHRYIYYAGNDIKRLSRIFPAISIKKKQRKIFIKNGSL